MIDFCLYMTNLSFRSEQSDDIELAMAKLGEIPLSSKYFYPEKY